MEMSGETQLYFHAIANPFSPLSDGAGIPSFPSVASQKVSGRLNGVFNVGSSGFGFIAVAPCLSNGGAAVFASDQSYVGDVIKVNSASLGHSRTPITSLPYTSAQLTDGTAGSPSAVRGRIVACALRIRDRKSVV